MRETLYIRLRSASPDAPTAYCIAAADARLSWDIQQDTLANVLARAKNRRLVLLVPGEDVRLTQVRVPAKSAAKVLQATPYTLEEQLAEDVDTLHFSLGPMQSDGSWPVVIVSRARMDQWLAPLREAGLAPDAVYPEMLCLPEPETPRWSVLAEDDHLTVRTGSWSGFSCMLEDLPLYLQAAGATPETILRIVVPRTFNGDFTRLEQPVELLPGFSQPLEALLQHLQPSRCISLLQGGYSQGTDYQRLLQPWRVAAMLLAAWIVVAGIDHGVQAFKLGKQVTAQDERNAERFRQLFPSEQRIVDLSTQAEQQMALLQGGGQKGSFMPLMETLSQAMGAASGLTVKGVQFRDGKLFVRLNGSDLQQLETLRGWFAQNRGATMEVTAAESTADGVHINLTLSPG